MTRHHYPQRAETQAIFRKDDGSWRWIALIGIPLTLAVIAGVAVFVIAPFAGHWWYGSSSSSSPSSSGSRSPNDIGGSSSTPNDYLLVSTSVNTHVYGFEYPVLEMSPQATAFTNVPPPAQGALQPFNMTFTSSAAGCGIAQYSSLYQPAGAPNPPQGIQWGFLQPAHAAPVSMSAYIAGMEDQTSYYITFYYAQRQDADPQQTIANTTISSLTMSLGSIIIYSQSAGRQTNGVWIAAQTPSFTYVASSSTSSVYPLLTITATPPSGSAIDNSLLIDAIEILPV